MTEDMPFTSSPFVKLTDSEIEYLKEIADKMNSQSINSNTFRYGPNNLVGFGGEIAFAKYYNLPYNWEEIDGGDEYDFKVLDTESGNVGTIDVKTITYENGDLLIPYHRELSADAYFLLERRQERYYGIIGVATKEKVKNERVEPKGSYSPIKVRRVPREKLSPIPESSQIQPVE